MGPLTLDVRLGRLASADVEDLTVQNLPVLTWFIVLARIVFLRLGFPLQ